MSLRFKKWLASAVVGCTLFLAISSRAVASEGDSSVFIFLGEAYGPSNFRYSWSPSYTWDVGLDMVGRGLYVGSRVWNNKLYAGGGAIALGTSVGIYGSVGIEFKFFKFLGLGGEFRAVSTSDAINTAVGMIGIGGVW